MLWFSLHPKFLWQQQTAELVSFCAVYTVKSAQFSHSKHSDQAGSMAPTMLDCPANSAEHPFAGFQQIWSYT